MPRYLGRWVRLGKGTAIARTERRHPLSAGRPAEARRRPRGTVAGHLLEVLSDAIADVLSTDPVGARLVALWLLEERPTS
jgi:hypothetical protein